MLDHSKIKLHYNDKYFGIPISKNSNLVNNIFAIDVNQPLPQFSTKFAKAFAVVVSSKSYTKSLYALIFENEFLPRLNTITTLLQYKNDNFTNLIAAEIISIAGTASRKLVVIVEKPDGIPLSEYITNNSLYLKEAFILKNITMPINNILIDFYNIGIVHGNINLDNKIYIDPTTKKITLCECISAPCGFEQKISFEPPLRAIADNIGRGDKFNPDVYANAVLANILLFKPNVYEHSDEVLLSKKFQLGSYNAIMKDKQVSGNLQEFFLGCLCDNESDRWTAEQVKKFFAGAKFRTTSRNIFSQSTKSIIFNNEEYYDPVSLSDAFYRNWNFAIEFVLKSDVLIKWVENGLKNPICAKYITQAKVNMNSATAKSSTYFTAADENMAKIIIALHPDGPFRIKGFSVYPEFLGVLLNYVMFEKKTEKVKAIAYIISKQLIRLMIDRRKDSVENADLYSKMEAAFLFVQKAGLGFGIERCLYHLNKNLVCQSQLIIDDFIFDRYDALIMFNIRNEEKKSSFVDRHLAAFLAEKINLLQDIFIKSLINFQELVNNPQLHMLYIVAAAQRSNDNSVNLNNIEYITAPIVNNILHIIKCNDTRKEVKKLIDKVCKEGSYTKLYTLITDPKYLLQDKIAFQNAVTQYREIEQNINHISDVNKIANESYVKGLKFSVVISFVVCCITFLFVFIR